MNIYDLHENPEQLLGFDAAPYKVPKIAFDVAKQRPELRSKLEPTIMEYPWLAYKYAYTVLKKGWPEAESYIKKEPEAAVFYAIYVLKRRWPEAEPYIMKDPWIALNYLMIVLRHPWLEAEPYIKKDKDAWQQYVNYKQDFIKKRKS